MTTFDSRGVPLGRVLLSSTALATVVGPFIFDWNKTHIFNPAWPPHAKFHNAQTMSAGAALSLATLYLPRKPGRTAQLGLFEKCEMSALCDVVEVDKVN